MVWVPADGSEAMSMEQYYAGPGETPDEPAAATGDAAAPAAPDEVLTKIDAAITDAEDPVPVIDAAIAEADATPADDSGILAPGGAGPEAAVPQGASPDQVETEPGAGS